MKTQNKHSTIFKRAKLHLAAKQYDNALEALKLIKTEYCNRHEINEYNLLIIEIKICLGDYNIRDLLNDTIERLKVDSDNELYARGKYLKGLLFTLLGHYQDAKEILLEAYLYFKRYDNLIMMKRALNRLAYVQVQTGSIDDAINNLKSCLEINERLGLKDGIQANRRNLAVVLYISGRIQESLLICQEIKKELSGCNNKYKCEFYLTFSLINAFRSRFKESLHLLNEAKYLSQKLLREKAIYYEYLGWIYNLEGKFDKAVETLKIGIELSNKIAPESALISQTKRLLADAYIGLKKYDLAKKTAEEALVVAEKIKERSEIAGCYRVFAQVAAHNGEKEKAIEYYKKAVDIFKLIQSRYELAVTRYLMATSGLFDNGERMALLYLAREYFASEEIEHYTKKVDAAIKKYRSAVTSVMDKTPHSTGSIRTVFIARHPKIRKIVEFAENVAESNMTVFLTGPTGSGKDHLAKYIAECSGRKGEFVTVNCAAIPETMIESELFGYKKGAFTGADEDRQGLFETADGGTFYLNEIADASPVFQAKLLMVIEKKTIRPLGENKSRPVDVRIIAATNHDLEVRIKENKFRFDLYHRLNEIPITLPPLDDRKEDIAELVKHFLGQNGCNIKGGKTNPAELGLILKERSWPGNVRQLKAEIDRLCLTTKGNLTAMVEHLRSDQMSDRDLLLKTLEETGWKIREAARRLNMPESTLRFKIKKYNLGN